MLSDIKKIQKTDLQVQKTKRVLITSMSSLLNECRFTKLTIDKLCAEAQLSRATFYSHFTDKYDLLEFWLLTFWTCTIAETDTYEDVREPIDQFANENKKIIKNLLMDADHQTIEIVLNFICSALDIDCIKRVDGKFIQKDVVTANICIGGIVYYLLWQVRNNFPPDVPIMNEHSFSVIKELWNWAKVQ